MDLSRVKEREALRPRREPYWQRLSPGRFLGYRPSARREGIGTWIGRGYDDSEQKYRLKALGDFANHASNERFAAAKKEAEQWARHVEGGGQVDVETVEDACRRYAEKGGDIGQRFERCVYKDPIARLLLRKLRKADVEGWRARLEATPAAISRRKNGERRTRARSPASVNRDMAALRAALNMALKKDDVATAVAWREPLMAIRNADRQRTLYLDRTDRRALLDKVSSEASAFVKAMCLLPLRPGALAKLRVSDFERRTRQLTVGTDKNGKPRQVLLPDVAAEHLSAQTKGKLPTAPLFMRGNGQPWTKDTWKGPIADAVAQTNLPIGVTAYTLRHSVISDLVTGGLSLLAVAQVSGTSVEMIERHYGHLNDHVAAEAMAGLAL